MHRYQAGGRDRRMMLHALGMSSVDELFAMIPPGVRVGDLELPTARSEEEVRREFWGYAARNLAPDCTAAFLGGGVYRHVAASVADALIQRGEFFTAYTPYQPEVSQGTLQAIFEFQSFVCQLTEEALANASLYDGATAVVEAVLMARRIHPDRPRVVVAASLHPEYRSVLETYCVAQDIILSTVPWNDRGGIDLAALESQLGDDVCAVVVQSPGFLGVVEDLPRVAELAHAARALAVHVVVEATSMGLLAPGGRFGFDVVCGELQAFGLPAAFGGPHLGFFSCHEKFLRQVPGRLVGETVDSEGARAYVLTLSTREQHIRRARATSNICTNHGLMALMASIGLSLLGKRGVREVALSSHATSEYVKAKIRAVSGDRLPLAFAGPTYNEFLVLHDEPEKVLDALRQEGILGGLATTGFVGEWPSGILIAASEVNTRGECDRLVEALGRLA